MPLSTTGKKVSQRHEIASQTKKTSGQAVLILKKKDIKVSAKDLVSFYTLFYRQIPEWHHSGFYKKAGTNTMGKTYFFTDDQIEKIIKDWPKIQVTIDEKRKEADIQLKTKIKGFYYYWDYNYGGKYGRKQNFKVLATYEGSEAAKPANFTTLKTKKEFELVKKYEGKAYYGWDEPKMSDFK